MPSIPICMTEEDMSNLVSLLEEREHEAGREIVEDDLSPDEIMHVASELATCKRVKAQLAFLKIDEGWEVIPAFDYAHGGTDPQHRGWFVVRNGEKMHLEPYAMLESTDKIIPEGVEVTIRAIIM